MTASDLRLMQERPKGRQKYSAVPTVVDDRRFASKHEARRGQELLLLERTGQISDLKFQHAIMLVGRDGPLLARNGRQMRLTVDFTYTDTATGRTIYEDAKGKPTRDYEVRRAVAAAMGIEVLET